MLTGHRLIVEWTRSIEACGQGFQAHELLSRRASGHVFLPLAVESLAAQQSAAGYCF